MRVALLSGFSFASAVNSARGQANDELPSMCPYVYKVGVLAGTCQIEKTDEWGFCKDEECIIPRTCIDSNNNNDVLPLGTLRPATLACTDASAPACGTTALVYTTDFKVVKSFTKWGCEAEGYVPETYYGTISYLSSYDAFVLTSDARNGKAAASSSSETVPSTSAAPSVTASASSSALIRTTVETLPAATTQTSSTDTASKNSSTAATGDVRPTSPVLTNDARKDDLGPGAIVGIVIGEVAAIAAIVGIIIAHKQLKISINQSRGHGKNENTHQHSIEQIQEVGTSLSVLNPNAVPPSYGNFGNGSYVAGRGERQR